MTVLDGHFHVILSLTSCVIIILVVMMYKILIVDDDQAVLNTVAQALIQEGYAY
jgi:PleD family two-component response regulator